MTSESAMSPLIRKTEAATHNAAGGDGDLPCPAELLAFLERVPDPRKRRGRRHTLACLLAVAAAAVLAGARSFTAIGEWAADASEAVLAQLGVRRNPRTGRVSAPDEATLRRAAQKVDPDRLDDVLAAWVASRHDTRPQAVALDGKTVRGARDHADPTSRAPHLMAAVDHADATVISQRQVDDKSNEITAAKPLLEHLDLTGVVVTADAIHTQRDLAEWLVSTKLAHYPLFVKANQPTLHEAVQDALTGTDDQFADRSHTETGKGHGRIETRTIRTASIADLVQS